MLVTINPGWRPSSRPMAALTSPPTTTVVRLSPRILRHLLVNILYPNPTHDSTPPLHLLKLKLKLEYVEKFNLS